MSDASISEPRTLEIGFGPVDRVTVGPGRPLCFIGGPCAIESREHSLRMAEAIAKICRERRLPFVFKSCFNKDCRSSKDSFHGVGIDEGLEILAEVRSSLGVPVTTDISDAEWAPRVADVVDLIQIPAYLCRQTHLLVAAGRTGRPVNIKKGQFMSPWNMINSVRKIETLTGNSSILLTERGTFFGYNMLINDFRSFEIMAQTGCPVCYDATHSIQLPTSLGTVSGGQRNFIPGLIRAAVGLGVQALFMEVHDDPDHALSDAACQLDLSRLADVLDQARRLHQVSLELRETGEVCHAG